MKIRISKHDAIFSQCVRERDGHTCQRCGRSDGRQDCSHIFSRRNASTRWDPLNAVDHCFSCHQYLGENPIIFAAWARTYLGDENYEELQFRARQIKKWTPSEKDEMYQHYRGELKRMQSERADGATGVLTLVGYL